MRLPASPRALVLVALLNCAPLGAGEPAPQPNAENATDPQKLLAAAERKRGATFPGLDPAFLVLPRDPERRETSIKLLTPEVRDMGRKAIACLLRTQNSDGSWSDTQFPQNTGVTALCCLALMAEGNQPRIGKNGKALDKGIEFILKSAQESGIIAAEGSNKYGPMYEHALSTLVLTYSYGSAPWYPSLRNVVSRGVQVLERSQHLDGGWRYQASKEGQSDISVTANVMWVLRAAKKCGFTVSAATLSKGVKYIEQCAMPDGNFRYRAFGIHAAPSIGGTCIVALCNAGQISHPLIPTARDKIAYDYQRYTIADMSERRYFMFGAFYASLAMFMSGDAFWEPWFKKTAAILQTLQSKDGEFRDEYGNTVYTTAMAALILQAPLGYLPLYER